MYLCTLLRLVPRLLSVSYRRGWYFFSRDLTYMYMIVCGQDRSKDSCTSLPFAGDSISALSLWYKRAPKSNYKNCRFAAFLRCLRTTAVLAHTKIHPSTFFLPYASHTWKKNTRLYITHTPAIDIHTVDVGGVSDVAKHYLDTVHMAVGS